MALTDREFTQMANGATSYGLPCPTCCCTAKPPISQPPKRPASITLAPDWAPSGSKSPLHELKVADLWDDEMLGDIFTDYELVEMVTSSAAQATNWDVEVGTMKPESRRPGGR